jgi:ATP-dependent helicase HrpA
MSRERAYDERLMSETPPRIVYPPELPVSQRRDDIARAIADNQVVIVAGATGSGKTTQLPKILLELGRQSIGHTQPRRIAARTIAERIAEELGQEVGELVGYQVRFTDRVGKDTKIKLMTDGILLNEIHRDRDLRKYDAIIIDEAHERSLTVDFLLGYLKQLLPRRPDLKVVITSATIDPESFSRHFSDEHGRGAPIIEVSGRTYPVEIRYRPLVSEAPEDENGEASDDRDYLQGINDALDELAREGDGDVLVFLSGENEIRDAEDAIRGRNLPGTEVLPLYGRLSAADQHRVFETRRTPGIRRRVVLATNVAETSLTVPGIRYVIDAGTARISRYSVRSKIQRLPIEAISQASANQRSGRSGRTSDGIAIRLYSEEDFARRPEYTEPEILRTNLAAVILQMISLGLGDIAGFPFLQPPDSRGIKDGLDLLAELGAVSRSSRPPAAVSRPGGDGFDTPQAATQPAITRVGKQLSQLPIDPRLARMVIESKRHGTTREVMAIVAALSIQDPRERPLERRAQADQQHARFVDPTSDFLTLLNLWNHLEEKQKEFSGNQFRRLVKSEYLNYLRVREWQDVYRQLSRMAKPLALVIGSPHANPDGIHRSLLAGLLSHIGLRDQAKKDYVGARQARFVVFPGSALAKKQPAAIMSAELVETSRLFARVNGAIDPAWAEPIAGDLVKRTYSEPHWEKKQGAVVAYERVTLYGVPIIAKRRVQFSRIDPQYARELFIRHALVEGEWDSQQAFDRANRALRKELAELEERTRRRDILYDDEAIFDFYNRRVPADVASTRDFEGWWKKARAETPDLLTMTAENLVPEDAAELDEEAFPSSWRQGDQTLALSYRFEPGADDDGVTVAVPLPLLAGLRAEGFDWQVPGLREELVTALIKSLPKHIRRNVVPAADWARKLLAAAPPVGATLTEFLAREVAAQTYTPVTAGDFDLERVPPHLRVTFAVVDERGKTVGSGKVLSALQASLKPKARESVARVVETPRNIVERAGITAWDFASLDRERDTKHGGNTIRAYPALIDEGSSVAIRLMSTPEDQAAAHRTGVRRLLQLGIPSPLAYVQEHLTTAEKLTLAQGPYRTTGELFDDAMVACIDAVLGDREVWTREQFEHTRDAVSAAIVDSLFQTIALVSRIIAKSRDADRAIRDATNLALIAPLGDARAQLDALVWARPGGPGFISATGLERLRRLPVYLDGIAHRVVKLAENPSRDRVWMAEVQQATARYVSAGGELPLTPGAPPALVRARWMLEELRLSLFAQHLGTSEPVSLQRITKALAAR